MLVKAGADKSIKFTRKRDILIVEVPLTNNDCREVIATVELMQNAVAKRIKAGQSVNPQAAELLQAIKLRPIEGTGLEVSVPISKLGKARYLHLSRLASAPMQSSGRILNLVKTLSIGDIDGTPDERKDAGYKKTIDAIQARGITINKGLSIKEIVAENGGKNDK